MNLIITNRNNQNICAWFDNNRMIQITSENIERKQAIVGDIYIAKVINIVKNINAAFVDIGDGEPCFLQLKNHEKPDRKLSREDEILVQISREGIKTKQRAVTCEINLLGRYLILTNKDSINISSKIKNVARRKELLSWLTCDDNDLERTECGFIVRTNANNATEQQIVNEKNYLAKQYKELVRRGRTDKVYSCVYRSPDEYICAVRDCYDYEIDKIVTDNRLIYNNIQSYLIQAYPELIDKLSLYEDESYSLSALYGLENSISKSLDRKVWLNSGAYLVIDHTEACTVIDVNSGKAIHGKKSTEDTFFNINKEAAEEILLQLRLRNISGIILIDFIDMEDIGHNEELMNLLRNLAAKDPLKTVVVDITRLGLVEMTRKKKKKPVHEQLTM